MSYAQRLMLVLFVLISLVVPLPGQEKSPATTQAQPPAPQPPAPKFRYPEFTIVGYADFPNEPEHQLALAKYTLSKGFTAVEATENLVEPCRKAGLKVRLGGSSLGKLIANAPKYKDDTAIFGYYISDRRSSGAYPGWAQIEQKMELADPNHPAMFINSAQMNQYNVFVDVVKPRLLLYYHYHYSRANHPERYYLYMQSFRDLSVKHGIPQMRMHGGHDPHIRKSMYESVAYGAQGFSFFPPHFIGCAMDQDRNAILDENGRPTFSIAEHAKAISDVALELKVLGPTLITLTHDVVYHTSKNLPIGAAHAPADFWFQPSGEPFLVGQFHDEKKTRYLLPVNQGVDKERELTIQFTEPLKIELLDKKIGKWRALEVIKEADKHVLRMNLAPSDGELLRVLPVK